MAELWLDMSAPTDPQEECFRNASELQVTLVNDDGLATLQYLAACRAIYFGDAQYPEARVRKYLDDRQQLVSVDTDSKVLVIRDL